jgi:hypothetical protein
VETGILFIPTIQMNQMNKKYINPWHSTNKIFWYQFPKGFNLIFDSFVDWKNIMFVEKEQPIYVVWQLIDFWYVLGQGLSSCWSK